MIPIKKKIIKKLNEIIIIVNYLRNRCDLAPIPITSSLWMIDITSFYLS